MSYYPKAKKDRGADSDKCAYQNDPKDKSKGTCGGKIQSGRDGCSKHAQIVQKAEDDRNAAKSKGAGRR